MLTNDLLAAVKSYSEKMSHPVTFVMGTGEHEKRAELTDFLKQLEGATDKLVLSTEEDSTLSPISFKLQANGKDGQLKDTGIIFSGIPGGHEFSSLVLAFLQAGGSELKLDESLQQLIKNADMKLEFETYISLSCHNCPDVVQALNQFALLNDNISNEMIDGGLFQDKVEANNIQGVPAVFLNGEPFANGKIDTAKLVDKLLEKHPSIAEANSSEPSLPLQDVVVIGGGPAGVAAAIYAARKGVAVTVVADRIGGQVKDTMDIQNFIGTKLTTGPDLSGDMLSHLREHDVTLKEGFTVKTLEKNVNGGKTHQVTLNTGEVVETKTVIIASGARWRELNVPGEKENIGNGVAYCPHCDGPFFKGKSVAVIGGGNSGVEAALDLAGIVKHVTVFEFMPTLKADQVLIDQMDKRANIDVIKNVATKSINAADGKVTSITYTDRETEADTTLDLSAVFVQIGLVPNSSFAEGVVERTKFGEVVINDRCQTDVDGIFGCGDVTTVPYKQIIIAMGEGSKAALSAFDYLLKYDA